MPAMEQQSCNGMMAPVCLLRLFKIKLFFPFFQSTDGYVQLKAQKHHQRIYINQRHQDKYCANGAIKLIVIAEMCGPERNQKSSNNGERCGKYRTRINERPAFAQGRAVIINSRSEIKYQQYNNHPAHIFNNRYHRRAL